MIVVGDFNLDGNLDIMAPGMTLLLGNGDGTLQKPSVVGGSAGAGMSPLETADFNGDGNLDVLALGLNSSGNGTLNVLLGNGNGTLQAPQALAVGGSPNAAAVGDFNRDGKVDIVAIDVEIGTVSLLLGNGDGSFQSAQTFSVGTNPSSIAVGDFNGDGWLDLAVAVSDSGYNPRLSVLLNDAHW